MILMSRFTASYRSLAHRDAVLSQAECQVTTSTERREARVAAAWSIGRTNTLIVFLSLTHTHCLCAYVIKRSIPKNQKNTVIKECKMNSYVKTSQMRTRRQSRRKRPRQQESAHSDRKRTCAAKTGVCNQLILMPCKCPAYIINMRACSNNWRGCAGYYLEGTGWSSSLDPSAPLRLGTCQVSASAAIKERQRKSVS